MKKIKKFAWPSYSSREAQIVSDVLRSNEVNYLFGNNGKKFEDKFLKEVGVKYALALANGTLAIDIALRAMRVQPKDEVLVTSRSFIATASSISLLGAIPVWCDVDLNSQNISIDEIKKNITKKTRGIICVHFAGFPCDMIEITKFAKLNKLFVIEDCAQAHGAKIKNKSVGSFGDISTWSFCNDKIMSLGGEGGMITTNNQSLYKFCKSFNNHGKNFVKINSMSKNIRSFPYIHDSIGSNYRLTEMQSALGLYQLQKLNNWNKLRSRNAHIFMNAIKDLPIAKCPNIPKEIRHAWYKLYITLQPKQIKKNHNRDTILKKLNLNGVDSTFGGCGEIYREKAFVNIQQGCSTRLKNARFLESNSIMILIHPTISEKEAIRRSKILREALISAQKTMVNFPK